MNSDWMSLYIFLFFFSFLAVNGIIIVAKTQKILGNYWLVFCSSFFCLFSRPNKCHKVLKNDFWWSVEFFRLWSESGGKCQKLGFMNVEENNQSGHQKSSFLLGLIVKKNWHTKSIFKEEIFASDKNSFVFFIFADQITFCPWWLFWIAFHAYFSLSPCPFSHDHCELWVLWSFSWFFRGRLCSWYPGLSDPMSPSSVKLHQWWSCPWTTWCTTPYLKPKATDKPVK